MALEKDESLLIGFYQLWQLVQKRLERQGNMTELCGP